MKMTGTRAAVVGLACGLIGFLLGSLARPPDDVLPPADDTAPVERNAVPPGTGPEEPTTGHGTELADLRARVAELEGRLAEARPVLLAEETADPGVAAVRILVLDEASEPRSDLEATVTRNVTPFRNERGKTDGAGRVEFLDLPPGPVTLSVRSPDQFRSAALRLTAGRVMEVRMRFARKGAVLQGVVVDQKSGPVAGVLVGLFRTKGEFQTQMQTKTDDAGHYRFENVPAGNFTLNALVGKPGDGRQPVRQVVVPESGTLEKEIVVGIRSLFGTVRDAETGQAIDGYTVSLARTNHIVTRAPDGEGEYEFLDAATGAWRMGARAPGYVQKSLASVEVAPGESKRIDFELSRAAVALVTVLDRKGNPATGTTVVTVRSGATLLRSARLPVGEGGLLKVDEIPPGEVRLDISVAGSGSGGVTTTLVAGENRLTIRLD